MSQHNSSGDQPGGVPHDLTSPAPAPESSSPPAQEPASSAAADAPVEAEPAAPVEIDATPFDATPVEVTPVEATVVDATPPSFSIADLPAPPADAAAPPAEPEAPKLPESFDELDLPDTLRRAIARIGWKKPTPVQALSFPPLHAGRDVLVQSHTGSGKTGAFCIPWLAGRFDPRPAPQTGVQLLVLLPTRELAKQVCDELKRLAVETPVEVLPIYGGTPMQPQLAALKSGVHAVVGTPGRVLDHIRRRSLDLSRVATVVLDECDEMLSMGFLEDIRAILDACTGKHLTALFSATIPSDIQRIAKRYMQSPVEVQLSGDMVAAAEIDHAYYIVNGAIKARDLLDVIAVEEPARAIVFCNTREETKLVANVLRREGYQAEELSSDLTQAQREKVMAQMREHKLRFLVATDVAARGIDITHVSHVINYSFPESAEVYIHRTGRTGRAGRTGTAISLIHAREIGNFYYLKLQYDTIVFRERFLPTAEQLAAQRTEVKLDAISKRFPELVSPEWVLLARNLMADPRGERVIGLLLERAMKQPPRPEPQPEDGERPAEAAAAPLAEGAEAPREDDRGERRESREFREPRDFREGRRDRRDRPDRRDRFDRPRRDGDRPSFADRRDGAERPEGGDRPDRFDRPRRDGAERPEGGDRPDRFDRPRRDSAERPEGGDRPDRFDRPRRDGAERPEGGDRPDRFDRPRRDGDRPGFERGDRRDGGDRDRRDRDDRFGRRRDRDRDRDRDRRPDRDRGPRPPRQPEATPVATEPAATEAVQVLPAPTPALVQGTGETGAPSESRRIPFDGRGRRGDRGRYVQWVQHEPGASAATAADAAVAGPTEIAPVATDLVEAPGELADEVDAGGVLGESEGRRKRRRKRRKRRGLEGAPGEATPQATDAGAPEGDEADAEGDDDDTDADATDAEAAGEPQAAEPGGALTGEGRRKRRRKRRRGQAPEQPPRAAAPAPTTPPPAPVEVTTPVPVPKRRSQDEIVIDIDEAELEVVTSEFGELDNIDEFALMDRRQAVIETLQEEVELEDVSRRDAAAGDAVEVEEDAADPETDAEPDAELVAEAAGGTTEGDADADAEAESEGPESEGSETDAEGKKKRRRRRRKKAAPMAPPELTAPPHKDFWEIWASKFSYKDFEDDKVGPVPMNEPEPPPAPAVVADAPAAEGPVAPAPSRPARPPKPPAPSLTGDADDAEFVKVQLNLGRVHGHKSAAIRNLLREYLGLEGRAIRDLTVRDASTLFRIHQSEVERCQAVLAAVVEGGVALSLEPAEGTREELRAPLPADFAETPELRIDAALEFPAADAPAALTADEPGT